MVFKWYQLIFSMLLIKSINGKKQWKDGHFVDKKGRRFRGTCDNHHEKPCQWNRHCPGQCDDNSLNAGDFCKNPIDCPQGSCIHNQCVKPIGACANNIDLLCNKNKDCKPHVCTIPTGVCDNDSSVSCKGRIDCPSICTAESENAGTPCSKHWKCGKNGRCGRGHCVVPPETAAPSGTPSLPITPVPSNTYHPTMNPSNAQHSHSHVKVTIEGLYKYIYPTTGEERHFYPSCSGGPYLHEDGSIKKADTTFSFGIRYGNPKKVLLVMTGGGMCFDGYTCIGSSLGGIRTYIQTSKDLDERIENPTGVLDTQNPDNPYKDYTIIQVADCTADLYAGSRKKMYNFTLPTGDNIQWEINHNGFANIISTLLEVNHNASWINFHEVQELSVIGDSSGGYGSIFVLPHLEYMMPFAKITIIADSAAGALNSYLFEAAFWNPSDQESTSWGIENNLFSSIGLDETFLENVAPDPTMLVPAAITILCEAWPDKINFGTVNTNFDYIQLAFWKGLRTYEDPLITDEQASFEWYSILVQNMIHRVNMLDNYRYVIDAGTSHSILYKEEYYNFTADDITLYDWNYYMLIDDKSLWKSVDEGSPF